MDFDLTSYKNYDPNTIYHDASATFIYTKSGKLYIQQYPTTHVDMMYDDKIFDDVYQPTSHIFTDEKNKLRKFRTEQIKYAILGRFAVENGDIIIAIWNKLDHYLFPSFIKALIKQYPAFKERFAVVVGNYQPKLLSDLINIEPSKKKVTVSLTPKKKNKKYFVGGREYTINDLDDLRKKAHTSNWEWDYVKTVLCHPDMKNYPELEPYIPARCNYQSKPSKPKWSDWIRAGAHEHMNFKDWLIVEHILFETK